MKIESDDITYYKCSNCLLDLPSEKFYNSKAYPKIRNYHSNYCKECFQIKSEGYKKGEYSSELYKMNLTLSHELLERIGYDISDLDNNSIHEQFMMKYGDIINKQKPQKTIDEKKLDRYLYQKRYLYNKSKLTD